MSGHGMWPDDDAPFCPSITFSGEEGLAEFRAMTDGVAAERDAALAEVARLRAALKAVVDSFGNWPHEDWCCAKGCIGHGSDIGVRYVGHECARECRCIVAIVNAQLAATGARSALDGEQ